MTKTKINAEIILDSINVDGDRLTTFRLTYQRGIFHSEFLTHRALSRNGASSRAIPVKARIKAVLSDPAYPIHWGANQPGMQANGELDLLQQWICRTIWNLLRYPVVAGVIVMMWLGLHKQVASRLLEPWMWITVVCSGTDFSDFFAQRDHPAAQPEFQKLARLMRKAMRESIPMLLKEGQMHLPYIDSIDRASISEDAQVKVSVARCAGESYGRATKRPYEDELRLYDRLVSARPMHASPLEHVAMASRSWQRSGNFKGWIQHRKVVEKKA